LRHGGTGWSLQPPSPDRQRPTPTWPATRASMPRKTPMLEAGIGQGSPIATLVVTSASACWPSCIKCAGTTEPSPSPPGAALALVLDSAACWRSPCRDREQGLGDAVLAAPAAARSPLLCPGARFHPLVSRNSRLSPALLVEHFSQIEAHEHGSRTKRHSRSYWACPDFVER
jgi:hypothetical protein